MMVCAKIILQGLLPVNCQLTGSNDLTLKSLLPVNWQQRFYDEMAAAS